LLGGIVGVVTGSGSDMGWVWRRGRGRGSFYTSAAATMQVRGSNQWVGMREGDHADADAEQTQTRPSNF
jgi:hypothetical protein